MEIKEGVRIMSNLTGEVYRVKAVRGMAMVLESEDGSNSVITQIENMKLFYEMIGNKKGSTNAIIRDRSSYLTIAVA